MKAKKNVKLAPSIIKRKVKEEYRKDPSLKDKVKPREMVEKIIDKHSGADNKKNG